MDEPLDPFSTFLTLDGPAATTVAVTPSFWAELESGDRTLTGWLVAAFHIARDIDHWEMHPAGDEILIALAGTMTVVLEHDGARQPVTLRPGTACRVPKGTWHTIPAAAPAQLLALTYGEGTEHRPAH